MHVLGHVKNMYQMICIGVKMCVHLYIYIYIFFFICKHVNIYIYIYIYKIYYGSQL